MKELYFIFIFVIAFFAYVSSGPGLDVAGMRTLLLLVVYNIFTIYRYSCSEYLVKFNLIILSIFKIAVSVVSVAIPFFVIGDAPVFLVADNILLLILCVVLFDFGDKIAKFVTEFFRERTGSSGGDMFVSYPPKTASDVLLPLCFYLVLIVILGVVL